MQTQQLRDALGSFFGRGGGSAATALSRSQVEAAIVAKSSLGGSDLAGLDLRGLDLSGMDLREVNLLGADLRDAVLIRADLRGARLCGADLSGAALQGAANAFFQLRYDTALVFVRITPRIALRCVLLAVPLGVLASVVSSWTLLRSNVLDLARR